LLIRPYLAIFFCCTLFWLLPFTAYADDALTEVIDAEITLHNDHYVVSADMVYQLSKRATAALQSGVPLFWSIQIKLLQPRLLLWDKTLFKTEIHYRLQYHALLNSYRVTNESSAETFNFSTLYAALDLMSAIHDIPLIEKSKIALKEDYLCALKIKFDSELLPLPLRPLAYIDKQWFLSSNWTLWPLKK
jgi:hypothetical protein